MFFLNVCVCCEFIISVLKTSWHFLPARQPRCAHAPSPSPSFFFLSHPPRTFTHVPATKKKQTTQFERNHPRTAPVFEFSKLFDFFGTFIFRPHLMRTQLHHSSCRWAAVGARPLLHGVVAEHRRPPARLGVPVAAVGALLRHAPLLPDDAWSAKRIPSFFWAGLTFSKVLTLFCLTS